MEKYPFELLVIMFVAMLAPLIAGWNPKYKTPVIVLEVILGIFIGPHVFNLANLDGIVGTLSELGLAFLLFMVGFDIDLAKMRGKILSRAINAWLLSFAVAVVFMFFFSKIGLIVTPPLMAALALSTTGLSVLFPVMQDRNELNTDFGKNMMAVAAMGEFGPLLLVSLLIIPAGGTVTHALLIVGFILLTMFAAFIAIKTRPLRFIEIMAQTMQSSGQLPVRVCLLVQVLFVALAAKFGLNVVIGAFASGLIVGLACKGEGGQILRAKLDAIGYGFLIPIFFISVGMKFEVSALWSVPLAPLQILLLLGLMLVIRGVPVILYKNDMAIDDKMSFIFYSATGGLAIMLIITEIGVSSGLMPADRAAILISVGMISVLLFPVLASKMRSKQINLDS
jgi:Kef-type K+ transport system membrane component KefB